MVSGRWPRPDDHLQLKRRGDFLDWFFGQRGGEGVLRFACCQSKPGMNFPAALGKLYGELGAYGRRPLRVPLQPLAELHQVVITMLEEFDQADDGVVRADLSSAIIQHLARYQNAKDDGLYPVLREAFEMAPEIEEASSHSEQLREAMCEIQRRTRHVKPMSAHADDPEGMECSIDNLVAAARASLVDRLPGFARRQLFGRLERAVERANTRPDPPHNPVSRVVSEISERLEHNLSDQSTPYHPGIDKVAEHRELPDR